MSATQIVARETEGRRIAVPAAFAAAFVPLLAGVALQLVVRSPPKNLVATLLYLNDKNPAVTIAGVIGALGVCLTAVALRYLYGAVRARRPEIPGAFAYTAVAGPLIAGLAQAGSQIATASASSSFASGPLTWQHAQDLTQSGIPQLVGVVGLLGSFVFAGTLVVLSLNAMRVGLLPRPMGFTGVIAGILVVVPIFPIPFVLAFWLVALALLIAGRFPGGNPPAWAVGEAVPWQSLQAAREEREGGGDGARGRTAPAGPSATPPPRPANPGAARRKRKKRA